MPLAITLTKAEGKPGVVYHPLKLSNIDAPQPPPKHLQVTILAAALNHRDLFIRQSLYPAISFTTPLLADGCGIVTGLPSSTPSSKYLNKRVILAPSQGWESSPDGPEGGKGITILGGTKTIELGTAQEVLVVREEEVEIAPEHLSDEQAAALPLTGLTAWRAFVTKSGNAEEGRNILVTGIGGGVALNVLQFAVGKGCNVYVTSGSEEKIEKAKALGAAGGVNYKNNDWNKELVALLPKDRKYIDAIIDGAGGDIVKRGVKFLKQGGVIVSYGMTLAPKVDYLMSAVLRNIDIRGSTMGSRKEFRDMVEFVNEKKIVPVVSKVVNGLDDLEGVEGLFQEMKEGKQFGKLVIKVKKDSASKL